MKDKILIVDDAELNRDILTEMLEEDYTIIEAGDGRTALSILEKEHDELAVVLLDLMMPEVDGFQVLEVMQKKKWMDKLPVLIISGETAVKAEKTCFAYGVSDFIKKPFDNFLVQKRVKNVVNLFQYKNELEKKVEKQTETLRKQYRLLQIQAEKLHKSNENIVDILGTVVEYRNLESGEHIQRVKGFTEILAKELMKEYPEYGLTEQQISPLWEQALFMM